VIEDAADAAPLARALVEGGLHALEVTLRTAAALDAVAHIAREVPGATVGVGSVIEAAQFTAAAEAGATFAVSPGASDDLHAAAHAARLPWLPGAQTVSEVLALRARGYRLVKFFPAHAAGGTGFLRAIAGPVPDMSFCPTGGISEASAPEYLSLPNVACVGGSWLTPAELLRARRWDKITALARTARALRP
jgi:2-dehydro-3-deoxyphosphogluconate aldolase/(4S)-4-hydroxy-2-oxoglutarate aldolase